jgi:hypothetical protein
VETLRRLDKSLILYFIKAILDILNFKTNDYVFYYIIKFWYVLYIFYRCDIGRSCAAATLTIKLKQYGGFVLPNLFTRCCKTRIEEL